MAREYGLISGDARRNEPPDLCTSRVPRMGRLPQGDASILGGALDPIHFGRDAVAGTPYGRVSARVRWEDIRRERKDEGGRPSSPGWPSPEG